MSGLLKKVNLRGWLNRSSRVDLATGQSTSDAASSPASLPPILNRPKIQKLLTPKKARRVFNNEIKHLAKDNYVKILQRRIHIATALFLSTAAAWIIREVTR
jgi:hypothetical protein